MQPAVSIIIPTYNVESYISATLELVKKQTYKNIEVIVVNDGSKDNTSEVAKRVLSNSDFPWTVIDRENQGVSVARNFGLSKAFGEYVLFLDGDDIISEFFVEKMYIKAKELDCDIVFCKSARAIQESGKLRILQTYDDLFDPKVHKRFERCASGLEVLRETAKLNVRIWTGSAIYRRDFLVNEQLSFVPGHWASEDTEFISKALFKAKRVASVSDILAFYIQRGSSVTHLEDRKWKRVVAAKEAFDCLEKFLEEEHIDKKTKKLVENYLRVQVWGYINNVYDSVKVDDNTSFNEIYAYAKRFKPIGSFKLKSSLFIQKILLSFFPGKVPLKLISYLRRAKKLVKGIIYRKS